jgi:hypothetical protein
MPYITLDKVNMNQQMTACINVKVNEDKLVIAKEPNLQLKNDGRDIEISYDDNIHGFNQLPRHDVVLSQDESKGRIAAINKSLKTAKAKIQQSKINPPNKYAPSLDEITAAIPKLRHMTHNIKQIDSNVTKFEKLLQTTKQNLTKTDNLRREVGSLFENLGFKGVSQLTSDENKAFIVHENISIDTSGELTEDNKDNTPVNIPNNLSVITADTDTLNEDEKTTYDFTSYITNKNFLTKITKCHDKTNTSITPQQIQYFEIAYHTIKVVEFKKVLAYLDSNIDDFIGIGDGNDDGDDDDDESMNIFEIKEDEKTGYIKQLTGLKPYAAAEMLIYTLRNFKEISDYSTDENADLQHKDFCEFPGCPYYFYFISVLASIEKLKTLYRLTTDVNELSTEDIVNEFFGKINPEMNNMLSKNYCFDKNEDSYLAEVLSLYSINPSLLGGHSKGGSSTRKRRINKKRTTRKAHKRVTRKHYKTVGRRRTRKQ